MELRQAVEADVVAIAALYHRIYQGKYPAAITKDFNLLAAFLRDPHNYWFLAEQDDQIVASVVYSVDPRNRLAKAFGAVVAPEHRGHNLTGRLLQMGLQALKAREPVDLVYVLTRTVHEAAQRVIEPLGYRRLGVFPNVHKAEGYETHCLAALYESSALEARRTDYRLHHRIKNLADIVCGELQLPPLEIAVPGETSRKLVPPQPLELIDAPRFVRHRYAQSRESGVLRFEFHAFNEPNAMMVSPDQSVEIFLMHDKSDGHCEVVGARFPDDVSFTLAFLKVADQLRDVGVRYIEMGIEASKPKVVESFLKAKFVPCAFFPAFQWDGKQRLDYVVMSRTFENLDFHELQFRGLNEKFLKEYFRIWRELALPPRLIAED